MKNQIQKLVRGVIYDDTNIAEASIDNSANLLSALVDNKEYITDEGFFSKDELYTCIAAACVANPIIGGNIDIENVGRNFIIPEKMVDERLRNQLEKIDISQGIVDRFMQIRKSEKEETISKIDDEIKEKNKKYIHIDAISENGEIEKYIFSSKYDAVHWIANQVDENKMDMSDATVLLNEISKLGDDE